MQPSAPAQPKPPVLGAEAIPPGTAAVVIAAHNEEAVIAATLKTICRVYWDTDIYVYCDSCTDSTAEIAKSFLPEGNVIEGKVNIGKSRGLQKMLKEVIYPKGYTYVTFADADTTMEDKFLVETLKVLRKKDVACAVGQVKSRWYPSNLISVYRTFGYALWQMVFKRLQSFLNAITIASGCSSTWKTRVLQQLEFDHNMSTEDFSLTIQAHRKHLGKIKYVSSAVVWTQDPFSVRSFRRQMFRWNRAWWEAVRRYRIGLHWFHFKRGIPVGISVLDISTLLITFDIVRYIITLVLLPALLIVPIEVPLLVTRVDSRHAILTALAWQYGSVIFLALIVSIITRRPRVALYSPLFLFLMYVEMVVTVQAIVSTMRSQYRRVPGQQEGKASVWISPERRKVADHVS